MCSRNKLVRGRSCDYKAMLKKTDIEPLVVEAIREIVRNKVYAAEIKKRIGVQIDTRSLEKERSGYKAKLKEVDLNKSRLEREIDSLPFDAKYRERKLHDMTLRLDGLYDTIVELEEKIDDVALRIKSVEGQAITLENIYKIMQNFDCIYGKISDEEKRTVVTALIKEINIFRNDESEYPLRSLTLNFPVFLDGGETEEVLWDKGNTVETVALLTRKKDVERIDIKMTVDKEDVTEKATYQKIKEYVTGKYGLNVHTKYIAEVKRKLGLPIHEAPNKVDVPKREYPACPEEKVKAIEEALKYFGLIK